MTDHLRKVIVGGVIVVLVGGAAVAGITVTRDDTAAGDSDNVHVELTTVSVEQRDLISYRESSATLGFTDEVTLSAPVSGTVTTVAGEGTAITAGTVVTSIDGAPVVALFGDVPGWRDLDVDSDDGVDVRQLETNLVALGYDPDGAIEIDETFDSSTAAAVEAWETALGLDDPDGEVPAGQMVFVPGELLVGEVTATVGTSVSEGASLLTGRVTMRRFEVPAVIGVGGTLDHVAATGMPVATGTVLFWQAGTPVVALEGDIASFPALGRDLAVGEDDGSDVKLIEQFLVGGGFDPDGEIIVDDAFDDATANAVARFWQSVGAVAIDAVLDPADVVLPAGSFVTVPPDLQVGDPPANGEPTADGPAITLTRPARLVMFNATVGDANFAAGAVVDVEFPDGTTLPGTVTSVSDVATAATDGGDATVAVEISVDGDVPAAAVELAEVPVTLRVVDEKTDAAFVVPVTALVALADGGFGVQVVDGTTATGEPATHYSRVEAGQFTDGMVAITGEEIANGLEVVVPS